MNRLNRAEYQKKVGTQHGKENKPVTVAAYICMYVYQNTGSTPIIYSKEIVIVKDLRFW